MLAAFKHLTCKSRGCSSRLLPSLLLVLFSAIHLNLADADSTTPPPGIAPSTQALAPQPAEQYPTQAPPGPQPAGIPASPSYSQYRDDQSAIKIMQPLADRGDVNAQLFLGKLYEHYQGRTVYDSNTSAPSNITESIKWFRKAAEQGNAEAQAQLGQFHYHGLGVPREFTEAAKWFRNAADQGNSLAESYLGGMYARGEGVKQDYAEAYFWSSLAVINSKIQQLKKVRDQSAAQITAEEKSAIDKRVEEWMKAHPTPPGITH